MIDSHCSFELVKKEVSLALILKRSRSISYNKVGALVGVLVGDLVGTFTGIGNVGDFDGTFGTPTGTGMGPVTGSGNSIGTGAATGDATGAATGVTTGCGGISDGAVTAEGDWVGISGGNGLGTISDDGDCESILPHPPQSSRDDSK